MNYKFIELDLTDEEKGYSRPLWHSYFFIDEKKIILGGEVKQYREINKKLLVLMEDYYLDDRNRNIWCFNEEGEKLWEIENRLISMNCEDKEHVDPYIGMGIDRDGVLRCGTFSGFFGDLDIQTGKVTNWKWSR